MDRSITVIIPPSPIDILDDKLTLSPSSHILTLEPELWEGLNEICQREESSVHDICTAVYRTMAQGQTLERGVRYFILDYFKSAATDEGHIAAGHGLLCVKDNTLH